jgi:hypothetical protein
MIDHSILDRRPNIKFVAPRSGFTIPEVEKPTSLPTPKETRINNVINQLNQVAILSESVEALVASRIKSEVLKLDITNPEDAVVAQAAARQFPELAIDRDGFKFVEQITFDMFNHCLQAMKAAGKAAGQKQELVLKGPIQIDKTDFGGLGRDKRPDINKSTIPFASIDLPAFIAAGVPILFSMLFPLINTAIKKDIIAHTHIVVGAPAPTPSGPGIPVLPV